MGGGVLKPWGIFRDLRHIPKYDRKLFLTKLLEKYLGCVVQ